MQILIVEDNASDVALLQELFAEGQHVDMHWVTNGEDALDFLFRRKGYEQSPRPDLVMLDLGLPRVGGYDVLRALKQDPSLATIPVIVLSTSRNPIDEAESSSLGAYRFISKPSNLEGYETLVDTLLQDEFPKLVRH